MNTANRIPIDFAAIAAAALERAETLVPDWLPEGRRQGVEWVAVNPTRADSSPGSFSVNLRTGRWGDFACNDRGGDLISLMAYVEGVPQAAAARKLREIVLPGTFSQGTKGTEGTSLKNKVVSGSLSGPPIREPREPEAEPAPIPIPAQDRRPAAHPKYGKPTATWTYRDAQGEPIAYVCRFDPPEGRKQYCPQTWDPEAKVWRWQAPPAPRSLYGLDRLAARPEALVIITEGEKCADACQALFPDAVVISSMNGAASPGKSDWRPLAGRRVRVWPDADAPGTQYAAAVAKLVNEAGADKVEVLDLSSLAKDPATGTPRELEKGWDAADALAGGWTPDTIAAAVWQAHEKAEAPKRKRNMDKPAVERPGFAVHEEWTGYGQPGLWWHSLKTKGDEVEEIDQWVCSPLWASAITSSERNNDFGLLVRFRNALGHDVIGYPNLRIFGEQDGSIPMRPVKKGSRVR